MTFAVRTLTAGDAETLKALNTLYGHAFEDPVAYGGNLPSQSYLAGLLAKDHFIAVVASIGDAIVGGLTAYVLDKGEQERSEIYIYDLAVADAHRRQGIATALIRHLQDVAAARGSYVIFVQADLVDAPAIALYESLGTKETAHHFDISVPSRDRR